MRTRYSSRHARDLVIDDLIRRHGINETAVLVQSSLQLSMHGAIQIVMRRAKAIGIA